MSPAITISVRPPVTLVDRMASSAASVRPPIIFTDIPVSIIPPVRRDTTNTSVRPTDIPPVETAETTKQPWIRTTIGAVTIAGAVTGIIALITLFIWITCYVVPWYRSHQTWKRKQKKAPANQEQWLAYVKKSFSKPSYYPKLDPIIEVHSTTDIEVALSNVGRDPSPTTPTGYNMSDLSHRSMKILPETSSVKETVLAMTPPSIEVISGTEYIPVKPLMTNSTPSQAHCHKPMTNWTDNLSPTDAGMDISLGEGRPMTIIVASPTNIQARHVGPTDELDLDFVVGESDEVDNTDDNDSGNEEDNYHPGFHPNEEVGQTLQTL